MPVRALDRYRLHGSTGFLEREHTCICRVHTNPASGPDYMCLRIPGPDSSCAKRWSAETNWRNGTSGSTFGWKWTAASVVRRPRQPRQKPDRLAANAWTGNIGRMEEVEHFHSVEAARNAAVRWLEDRGGYWGGERTITHGKFGAMAGQESGIATTDGTHRRLRLDFDPIKGCHYNGEAGKGSSREKKAFCFPGPESLIESLASGRNPR